MNSKLAITLFTCSILANSSAFAMLTDGIDVDGIHGQPSSSSTLPVTNAPIKRSESPDFEFALQGAFTRKVLKEMEQEILANSSAFAMLTDGIDVDGIHGQPSSSSTLPVCSSGSVYKESTKRDGARRRE